MTHHITDEQIDRIADDYEDECGRIRVDKVFDFARAVLALAAPAPAVPSDEREAFEAWAMGGVKHRKFWGSQGQPKQDRDRYAWAAWQARAALTAAPTPPAQAAVPEDVAHVGYLYDFTIDGVECKDWWASVSEWSGVPKAGVSNIRMLFARAAEKGGE